MKLNKLTCNWLFGFTSCFTYYTTYIQDVPSESEDDFLFDLYSYK